MARPIALALALAVACHRPPTPVTPATPVRGLDAAVFQPHRLAVEDVADVVFPRSVAQVTRNDVWGTGDGTDEVCVLAQVTPAERLELHLRDETPADAVIAVTTLPPPPALPWAVGATVRTTLAPVAPGDPRGPLADLSFTLPAAARVTLDWTTRHTGAGPHGAPHRVQTTLYGPAGGEQASVSTQFEKPERRAATWDLGPGTYVLRAVPDPARLECEAYDTPFGVTKPPAWCALPDDDEPWVVEATFVSAEPIDAPPPAPPAPPPAATLPVGATTPVAPGRPPEAPTARVAARRGEDLVIRWTPATERLGFAWTQGEASSMGACEEGACRFWDVPFDVVEVSVGVREAPAHVELQVTSLPLPEDRIRLDPGTVYTGPIRPPSPGDPRGPLLDLEVVVTRPGRHRLGVAYPEGSHQPQLTPLGRGLQDLYLNAMGAEPYEAAWYDVAEPGVYAVRVATCPDCPEVELQVEWQPED